MRDIPNGQKELEPPRDPRIGPNGEGHFCAGPESARNLLFLHRELGEARYLNEAKWVTRQPGEADQASPEIHED